MQHYLVSQQRGDDSIDPSKVCEPFCWLLSDEIRVLLSLMKVIHSYRGLPQMKNHIVDFFGTFNFRKYAKIASEPEVLFWKKTRKAHRK